MKLIKIESCMDCPYAGMEEMVAGVIMLCTHELAPIKFERRTIGKLMTGAPIPSWCPLPDVASNN